MAEIARGERNRAERIVVFNHKGGVGKTTLTANIAFALAGLGKTVLIVDADPQCNISALFIEAAVVDKMLDESDDPRRGQTLWSALMPIVEATGDAKLVRPVELRQNVHILAGDVRLAEFETDMPKWWGECYERRARGLRATTALAALVNQVSSEIGADVILYDCGPNIGPLNRCIVLDADGFVVPSSLDLFSLRAVKTLGVTLDRWIRDWQTIAELAPKDSWLLPGKPKLLGYVAQRYKIYGARPAHAQAQYLPKLRIAVDELAALLRKIDPQLVTSRPLELPGIREYVSLSTASQSEGVPMWDVSVGTQVQRDEVQDDFVGLARAILLAAGALP